MYIIRNDLTGHVWKAFAAEARLYAVGGLLDTTYTVFGEGGGGSLIIHEIK